MAEAGGDQLTKPHSRQGARENADFPLRFLFVYKRQYQSELGEVME